MASSLPNHFPLKKMIQSPLSEAVSTPDLDWWKPNNEAGLTPYLGWWESNELRWPSDMD